MASSSAKITAKDIETAIFHKYTGLQSHWIALREVTIDDEEALAIAPGRTLRAKRNKAVRRRIDVLLISHKNSSSVKIKRERIALEIKVSRSDFLAETDEKRAPWRRFADKFAYVAPEGLIRVDELPEGCGLMEYRVNKCGGTELAWKKLAKADPNPDRGLSPNFGHYILSRLHEAEARLRRLATI